MIATRDEADNSSDVSTLSNESETQGQKDARLALKDVLVRGAFGQPFVDVIRGSCGTYTPQTADTADDTRFQCNNTADRTPARSDSNVEQG